MQLRPRIIGLFVAASLFAMAGVTIAAQAAAPADIIKERQDSLKEMGAQMKAIIDQLKSGKADKAVMVEAAKKLDAYAKALPSWFPAGTGPEAGVKTAAKPEIWTQRADFDAAAAKLAPEADKLVMVVDTGDADAIGAQMKAVGGTCGACHKQFRLQDEKK
jgi:cytochrome c556